MGAVASISYAALDQSIAGMVLDSPFSSFKELVVEIVKKRCPAIPKFAICFALQIIRTKIQKKLGFSLDNISPINYVSQCFVPVLFVHGQKDNFVDPDHSKQLLKKYAGDKGILIAQGNHNSVRTQNDLIEVKKFFQYTLHCYQAKQKLNESQSERRQIDNGDIIQDLQTVQYSREQQNQQQEKSSQNSKRVQQQNPTNTELIEKNQIVETENQQKPYKKFQKQEQDYQRYKNCKKEEKINLENEQKKKINEEAIKFTQLLKQRYRASNIIQKIAKEIQNLVKSNKYFAKHMYFILVLKSFSCIEIQTLIQKVNHWVESVPKGQINNKHKEDIICYIQALHQQLQEFQSEFKVFTCKQWKSDFDWTDKSLGKLYKIEQLDTILIKESIELAQDLNKIIRLFEKLNVKSNILHSLFLRLKMILDETVQANLTEKQRQDLKGAIDILIAQIRRKF